MRKATKPILRPLPKMEPLRKLEVNVTMRLSTETLQVGNRKLTFLQSYLQAEPVLN